MLHELLQRYFRHGVARSAASLAYYLLFSLFPMIVFLSSVLSVLDLSAERLIARLHPLLPVAVEEIIRDYIVHIQSLSSSMLLYAGLVLTVWMVSRSVLTLQYALQKAYQIRKRGPLYMGMMIVVSVLLLLSLVVTLVFFMISGDLLRVLNHVLSLSEGFINLWTWLRLAAAPVYVFFVLSCFYAIAGTGQHRFRNALPGALFVLVLWNLATWGFSWYVGNLGNYSTLYGSIGAIMVLMLWLDLTGNILILGGELNAILAKKRGGMQQ